MYVGTPADCEAPAGTPAIEADGGTILPGLIDLLTGAEADRLPPDMLELLVLAGLTPLQALHAATGAAGGILGQPDLGVLRAGAVADLLIVAGNPAEDIKAARDTRLVIQAGKVLEELVIEPLAE